MQGMRCMLPYRSILRLFYSSKDRLLLLLSKASQELYSLMSNYLTVFDQICTANASIKSLNLHRIETKFDYKPPFNKVGQFQISGNCLIELIKLEDQLEEWYTVGLLKTLPPQVQVMVSDSSELNSISVKDWNEDDDNENHKTIRVIKRQSR